MANAIAAAAQWVTQYVAAALSVAEGTIAYQAIYFATEAALYYGTSQLLSQVGRPDLPTPEFTSSSIKQAIPERTRGYGRYRTSGPYMLYAAQDGISYDVIALHDGKINAITKHYLNDNEVTLISNQVQSPGDRAYGNSSDLVWIYERLGAATETNYSEITAALPTLWPSTARGDGVASFFLKCKMGKPEKFGSDYPDGLPIASGEIEAQLVYDWRKDSTRAGGSGSHRIGTPSTWEWTDNPTLCAAHYITQEMGEDFEEIIAPNLSFWTTAANVCDETVTLPDSTTQKRYTCGGPYYCSNGAGTVLGAILMACGGFLAEDGRGGLIMWAGKWYTPTVTIDDTLDPIEAYYFERGRESEENFNAFDVSYVNPAERYNKGDAGRWRNEAAITEAGEVRATTLDLPWVQNHWQAQRCAKIYDRKTNARLSGYFVGGLSLIQAYGEMVFNLNITDCAALTGITVMPTKIEILDLMSGKVKVSFVELTEEAFTFDSDEYVAIDASTSGGTGSNTVNAPDVTAYQIIYDENDDGTYSAKAQLQLDQLFRNDVDYQVRYRTTGSYTQSGTIDGALGLDFAHAQVTSPYLPVTTGTVYIQVRAVYGSGPTTTEWGTEQTMTLSGVDVAPEPVAFANITTPSSGTYYILIGWAYDTGDPNYHASRVYRNTTNDFSTATDISGPITATGWFDPSFASATTYYYWVVAENSHGTQASEVATTPTSVTTP